MAKSKKSRIKQEIKDEAIRIVDTERRQWEDAVCWVTDKVGFRMRQMIRTFRKFYWGVFDTPKDEMTGREKTWVQLAMKIVEDYVKNINMGSKDVNFRAKHSKGYAVTDLVRSATREFLNKMYFGEILDASDRQLCIDGTVVWKTWKGRNGDKVKLNRTTVDLLNIYIDPTAENIQSAYRFTERSLLLPDQIKGMTGWENTSDVKGSKNLNVNDSGRGRASNTTTAELVDAWEMWGKIPMWLLTGDKKAEDAYTEIDGHIVASGLESGQAEVHLIEENKNKDKDGNIIKPYEELRDTKVTGRWYGLGRIERILKLNEWLNAVVNIRINRSYISQLGLFKIKKGAGITPQMLQKLPVNGAIPVNNMEDIAQMQVSEVGASSYKDEEIIKEWATSITSSYPLAAGGDVPASQTATTSAIQNQNAKTAFTLTKEAKGAFLERWIDRHVLPIIAKSFKIGDIVSFSRDDDEFNAIVERVVSVKAKEKLDDLYSRGIVPSEMEVQNAIAYAEEQLKKQPQMFVELVKDMVVEGCETKVYFTNEDLDTAVTVQNLLQLVQITPEYKDQIIRQVYDLMGLEFPRLTKSATPNTGENPAGNAPESMGMPKGMSLQSLTEAANVGPMNVGAPNGR